MVEVQESGLGSFQKYVLAGCQRLMDDADRVADEGGEHGGVLVEVARRDVCCGQRQAVVDLGQDQVLLLEHHLELLAKDLRVEKVLHPDPDPGRLVGVRRADAPLRRTQLVSAQVTLGEGVDLLVVRHDQVGVARDP